MAKTITRISFLFLILIITSENISAQIQHSDSSSVKIDTNKFVMKKSAWGAVLRSAVLPGFGQFYNESYWKIPVVLGALGYLVYQWNSSNNSYIKYRDLYNWSLTTSKEDNIQKFYYDTREKFKDQRDLFAVFIGLAYFLNLVDAYVDAHLFDFDIKESVSTQTVQLSLKIKF